MVDISRVLAANMNLAWMLMKIAQVYSAPLAGIVMYICIQHNGENRSIHLNCFYPIEWNCHHIKPPGCVLDPGLSSSFHLIHYYCKCLLWSIHQHYLIYESWKTQIPRGLLLSDTFCPLSGFLVYVAPRR